MKHLANRQIGVGIHDDTVLVDFLNLGEVDDVRTVDTHKRVG